jgi:ribonuclease HII
MQTNTPTTLKWFHDEHEDIIEIGVDEAGRGPLFGRVYTAAVVLPKYSFDFSKMKDSKKFHSKKKIVETSNYIKENALAWSICYEDETTIDKINILQATQQSMHASIRDVQQQMNRRMLEMEKTDYSYSLLIDGNYFQPMTNYDKTTGKFERVPYMTVTGGDNIYASIAAASILAKVARDQYIEELCLLHPELVEKYGIDKNKGYGAKKHMDGIKKHGISEWHRRSFGPCKTIPC